MEKVKEGLEIAAEVLVRVAAALVLGAFLLGYRVLFVMSGSMEPVIREGQMIVVRRVDDGDELQIGDVITYQRPEGDYSVTHRIVRVTDDGYVTKGDYNVYEDQKVVEPWMVRYRAVWW